ncbi:MAG: ATP-binding protein, partial [Cyanobacteria bacterium J06632_22]
SLGKMVGGVAHEINNPLSFIVGNAVHTEQYAKDLLSTIQLYQQQYPQPISDIEEHNEEIDIDFLKQDFPKVVESIQTGAERIRQILSSLKVFSHMDEEGRKRGDIHAGIDSTLVMLRSQLRSHRSMPEVEILKEYGPIPPIDCYPGQLNQVFMNLLSNASDSLREKMNRCPSHHPQIKISTCLEQQNQVKISIVDNGIGIPDDIQHLIFDPFFSTKSVGDGTGLGLSVSYQIVTELHDGTLALRSTVGEGAEFVITLPFMA